MRSKIVYLDLLILLLVSGLIGLAFLFYFSAWKPRYYLMLSVIPGIVGLLQLTMIQRKALFEEENNGSVIQIMIARAYPVISAALSVGVLVLALWDAKILSDLAWIGWPVFVAVGLIAWIGYTLHDNQSAKAAASSALSDLSGQVESLNVNESTILKKIVNGILVVDAEGDIALINDAAKTILGCELGKDELIHQPLISVLHPSEEGIKYHAGYDIVTSFQQRILKSAEPLIINQMIFVDKKGNKKTLNISVTPIRNSQNEITRFILVLQDMTERYELDKMRMDFISIASHELRTPLTSINGYLSMMMPGDMNDEDRQMCMERISISSKRLGKLVQNILNISRIEQGKLKTRHEPVNLYTIANDELANMIPLAEEKKITLYALPPSCQGFEVIGDEDMLREVMENFMGNAIKYGRAGGEIRLNVKEMPEGKIRFEVHDNGIGIEPKHINNLFQQFYRVDGDLVQQQQGTGLGLYIIKKYVESMGGEVGVESQLAVGSTFYFILTAAKSVPAEITPAVRTPTMVSPTLPAATPSQPNPGTA